MLSSPVITQNPEPCPYLNDRISRMETFFGDDLSPVELESYLSAGWRKFGLLYFRPACNKCRECIPLRIDVQNFEPSKSQKRVRKKNQTTKLNIQKKKELILKKLRST